MRNRCLLLLWFMLALMGGSFAVKLDAADAAKKKETAPKAATAPSSASQTPKKPLPPGGATGLALADADNYEDVAIAKMKAQQGDVKACIEMSVRYKNGYGVERDVEACVMWMRKAAEAGYAPAQNELAAWYGRGINVKQDWAQAYHWYMKAAEAGSPEGMYNLGFLYLEGNGVAADSQKMLFWFEKSAAAGYVRAQGQLGLMHLTGKYGAGVDLEASSKWFTMGAEQDDPQCLFFLGFAYLRGEGVPLMPEMSVRLWQRAAEQGYAHAQVNLASCYSLGKGIVQDAGTAYYWCKLAAKQGDKDALKLLDEVRPSLTKKEIAWVDSRVEQFKPRPPRPLTDKSSPASPKPGVPKEGGEGIATGTGFFIGDSGYLATNYHVVKGGQDIQVLFAGDESEHATVVAKDEKADLAILKIKDGVHLCLPIISSDRVKLGASVATVGFPNPGVQGVAPKLSKGEIASLAGIQDDPNCFQISVPLQPGNSGGCLVDAKGNVVGVVCAIMDQGVALATTGTLANSVGYAVKSDLLIKLAESVPHLAEQLRGPKTRARDFEDIVSDAQDATVLVVVKYKE